MTWCFSLCSEASPKAGIWGFCAFKLPRAGRGFELCLYVTMLCQPEYGTELHLCKSPQITFPSNLSFAEAPEPLGPNCSHYIRRSSYSDIACIPASCGSPDEKGYRKCNSAGFIIALANQHLNTELVHARSSWARWPQQALGLRWVGKHSESPLMQCSQTPQVFAPSPARESEEGRTSWVKFPWPSGVASAQIDIMGPILVEARCPRPFVSGQFLQLVIRPQYCCTVPFGSWRGCVLYWLAREYVVERAYTMSSINGMEVRLNNLTFTQRCTDREANFPSSSKRIDWAGRRRVSHCEDWHTHLSDIHTLNTQKNPQR